MLCKVYNTYMDEKILILTEKLKNAMENDPRFLRLKEIEEKMNDDESVMRLAYHKDMENDKYNDLLKIYDENHPLVKQAQKALYDANQELNNHLVVKSYMAAYLEVKMVLHQVNNILFADFKGEGC